MKARRNDPCPCGSGKKYKKCCMQQEASAPPVIWQDEKGFHIVSLGTTPSAEQLELMTKRYQNEMRNSPLWKDIVNAFIIHTFSSDLLRKKRRDPRSQKNF